MYRLTITKEQCRMARAALGLGVRDLAEAAGVAIMTVARFERGDTVRAGSIAELRSALERKGVIFIDENGGGAGVRLAKRSKAKGKKR